MSNQLIKENIARSFWFNLCHELNKQDVSLLDCLALISNKEEFDEWDKQRRVISICQNMNIMTTKQLSKVVATYGIDWSQLFRFVEDESGMNVDPYLAYRFALVSCLPERYNKATYLKEELGVRS